MARWQILCDFDGTITEQDVLGVIFSRFAPPEWLAIEAEIDSGAISMKDGITRQTASMHVSQTDFDAVLDEQRLDPGFKDFLAEVDRLGLPFTVASSGYDYSIQRIFANHGINYLDVAAGHIEFGADDTIAYTTPNANADCAVDNATCKCSVMGRLRNRKTVFIGDGTSDQCPAEAADFVFAKGSLIDYCRANGIAHVPFRTFAELVPLLALVKGEGEELLALSSPLPARG
jgi:2,3-diketo-5-methylthio-1-phosphopentane phosphatase